MVINFFHISHNLTWYSAIVHKFTRIYPVCSTYELTKQFMQICVKRCTIDLKKNNLYSQLFLTAGKTCQFLLFISHFTFHTPWNHYAPESSPTIARVISSALHSRGLGSFFWLISFVLFAQGNWLLLCAQSQLLLVNQSILHQALLYMGITIRWNLLGKRILDFFLKVRQFQNEFLKSWFPKKYKQKLSRFLPYRAEILTIRIFGETMIS